MKRKFDEKIEEKPEIGKCIQCGTTSYVLDKTCLSCVVDYQNEMADSFNELISRAQELKNNLDRNSQKMRLLADANNLEIKHKKNIAIFVEKE